MYTICIALGRCTVVEATVLSSGFSYIQLTSTAQYLKVRNTILFPYFQFTGSLPQIQSTCKTCRPEVVLLSFERCCFFVFVRTTQWIKPAPFYIKRQLTTRRWWVTLHLTSGFTKYLFHRIFNNLLFTCFGDLKSFDAWPETFWC